MAEQSKGGFRNTPHDLQLVLVSAIRVKFSLQTRELQLTDQSYVKVTENGRIVTVVYFFHTIASSGVEALEEEEGSPQNQIVNKPPNPPPMPKKELQRETKPPPG